jgi:ribosomal protein S24E
MKYIIVQENYNKFMKRKEVVISIDHTGGATPSLAGLQLLLSKDMNTAPEHIEIKNIFSYRGKPGSKAKIFVWDEPKVADLSKPKEQPAEEKKEGE